MAMHQCCFAHRLCSRLGMVFLAVATCSSVSAQSYLDKVSFGNAPSESAHSLVSVSTTAGTGGLGQTMRRCNVVSAGQVNGGHLTVTMTVDPVWRNYFTLKLWGDDDSSQSIGRLYLYVSASNYVASATNNYQIGYRHEGDYICLSVAANDSPLPGRFFYSTTLLPLWMTQGRTNLTLRIVSTGRLYPLGSGGPPGGNYQFAMTTDSRGIYAAYTHTQPVLDPVGETQGTAPTTTTRPSPTVSVLNPGGTYYNGIVNYLNNRLGRTVTTANFKTWDIEQLAHSYSISNLFTAGNAAVVSKVMAVIDCFATNFFANPGNATTGWGGSYGPIGHAIAELQPQLSSSFDVVQNYGAGGTISRRAAWGQMLQASRDSGRFNRRALSNQGLWADSSIYLANRGMLALNDPNAFSETNAQRYLKEALGLAPWLGSDLPGGGSELPYGTNYFQVTENGQTREFGYLGCSYGEMQVFAADFYRYTTNSIFRDQAIKMIKARVPFRRPMMEVSGANHYRIMEGIGLLAWRGASESDGDYAGQLAYGDRGPWANGMRVAGVTLDPDVVGYAKQMLADNQYFESLVSDSRQYNNIGNQGDSRNALDVFQDYLTVANATDNGTRLPMTDGQPDFAWADEDNGVIAAKKGNERLWLSAYWQAGWGSGVNGLGRFHYSTNNYERYGVLEVTPQINFSGSFYVRPNRVDLPYKTVYTPPDNPINAYAGERLPLGASDPGATDDSVFRGKAQFWTCRYGNFLIGINRDSSSSFPLATPSGFTSGTNMIDGQVVSEPVMVAPRSTVVLYLDSASDPCPAPKAPLSLAAVGHGTPSVVLDWSPACGAQGYNVKRALGSGGPYTTIANVTSTNYADTNVVAGGVYYYVVSGTNTCRESDYDSMENFASAGLPAPWMCADVGSVGTAGDANYSDGTFTIAGAGSVIGSTADSFQFVYCTLTNNGAIVVRIASSQLAGGADKVGVMMREDTSPGSRTAVMMYDKAFDNARFARRQNPGSGMNYYSYWDGPNFYSMPVWLRLERVGDTFTGYSSSDGTDWTAVGTNTFTMNSTLLVGMVVCSRNTSVLNTSTFDNVALPGWPASPEVPASLEAVAGDAEVVLSWNPSAGATSYNLKRSLVSGTDYITVANALGTTVADMGLTNGTTYYYVVSALNDNGESADSAEEAARPVSLFPIGLSATISGGQLQFTWPETHLGWRLEAQTNANSVGLSTNWVIIPDSEYTNQMLIPVSSTNDVVFYRLVYP